MSAGKWQKIAGQSPVYVRAKVPRRFLIRQRAHLRALRDMIREGSTPAEVEAAVAGALAEVDGLLR